LGWLHHGCDHQATSLGWAEHLGRSLIRWQPPIGSARQTRSTRPLHSSLEPTGLTNYRRDFPDTLTDIAITSPDTLPDPSTD
jgi:hypothetical protein